MTKVIFEPLLPSLPQSEAQIDFLGDTGQRLCFTSLLKASLSFIHFQTQPSNPQIIQDSQSGKGRIKGKPLWRVYFSPGYPYSRNKPRLSLVLPSTYWSHRYFAIEPFRLWKGVFWTELAWKLIPKKERGTIKRQVLLFTACPATLFLECLYSTLCCLHPHIP